MHCTKQNIVSLDRQAGRQTGRQTCITCAVVAVVGGGGGGVLVGGGLTTYIMTALWKAMRDTWFCFQVVWCCSMPDVVCMYVCMLLRENNFLLRRKSQKSTMLFNVVLCLTLDMSVEPVFLLLTTRHINSTEKVLMTTSAVRKRTVV